jgi:hypothetical protein
MVCIVLFAIITHELLQHIDVMHDFENQRVFFIGMLIAMSVGFTGITDSVHHINWKFHAIVSPQDFHYHIKRSALFLSVIFGLLFMLFVFMAIFINVTLLPKYVYCMLIYLLLSTNIAFINNSILTKSILLLLSLILTVWISTLHIAFSVILFAPVFLTYIKAKNEYKEWYFL